MSRFISHTSLGVVCVALFLFFSLTKTKNPIADIWQQISINKTLVELKQTNIRPSKHFSKKESHDYISPLEEAVLTDPDPNIRLVSIQRLTMKRDPHLEDILFAVVKDTDPSIREFAYLHLYRINKDKATEILFQDSISPDRDIRLTAIESSGQLLGSEAIEILSNATEDNELFIKQMAFQQLSQMKSEQAVEVLRKRLLSAHPKIRIMAIEAMASKGEMFAREAALQVLQDNDELVRSKAKELLIEIEASEN